MLLTRAEVVDLTGLQRKSRQIRWLREQGIRHWVGADGHPRVPRAEIEGQPAQATSAKPDFSALAG